MFAHRTLCVLTFAGSGRPDPMLIKAPQSLNTWVKHFADEPIPVRARTIDRLAEIAGNADEVSVGDVAPLVLADPMMTVRLLSHVAQIRAMRGRTPAETVAQAMLMIGVPPFFRDVAGAPVIDDVLAEWPRALAGVNQVLQRSWRAADFALAFAVYRKDADAEVIHEAALMHDLVETLLWCHAPTLAMAVDERIARDPARDATRAQRAVLNIELCDLAQALFAEWRLPELLLRVTNDRSATDPQARSVLLALRIARHSSDGWDAPVLEGDLEAAADLLGLSPEAIRERLRGVDGEATGLRLESGTSA